MNTRNPKQIIGDELKQKDGLTLPQLVRSVRDRGLSEQTTRSAAQSMIEKGELKLDREMQLRVAEKAGQEA